MVALCLARDLRRRLPLEESGRTRWRGGATGLVMTTGQRGRGRGSRGLMAAAAVAAAAAAGTRRRSPARPPTPSRALIRTSAAVAGAVAAAVAGAAEARLQLAWSMAWRGRGRGGLPGSRGQAPPHAHLSLSSRCRTSGSGLRGGCGGHSYGRRRLLPLLLQHLGVRRMRL